MKKFVFILAMVLTVAALMAVTTRTIAVSNTGVGNAPSRTTREVFYTQDFETGATDWTHYDGAVSPNMWHIYNDGGTQGNCWWMGDPALASGDNIGGYYNHQYLVLDTPVIPIAAGNSTLTFKMKTGLEEPGVSGNFDGWDSFNIRISTNSGISYTVIPAELIVPTYDFDSSYAFGSEHGETPPIPAWGGVHPWTLVTVDLSSYLTSDATNVKIRFAFASDPAFSTVEEPTLFGVMVDDIALAGFSNQGVNTGMSYSSLVPTAGDFWHIATDASAPSPTHIMSSKNSQNTYVNNMLNYLVSPSITLPAGATQIIADFQMRGTYTDPGVFPDVDYFGWEISPDNGLSWRYMSNPSADTTGNNYVYSGASATWGSMINSYTLDGDITIFAGQTVKFRWYFQSNDTDPIGFPLEIDDFQIFSITAAPASPNLVSPVNGQANLPVTGFNLDWSASSLGAFPEWYTVCLDMDDANLEPGDFFAPTYTLEILPVYNPADSLYYLYSYCNTNDIPDLTFTSGQTWYWTVVASITDQPDAYSEIFRFDIGDLVVVNTFPWEAGFEDATFPPTNWSIVDVDGGGSTWTVNTTAAYVHTGAQSATHTYGVPNQNGWMITPAIALPISGNFRLSWWNYNQYPTYMYYNGVKVNTNPNPNDPGWLQIWSQDTPAAAWSNEVIDISDYTGQIVYFAFIYQGNDAENWYVDDISIFELTTDDVPPIITHLPVLNTPRPDTNYEVYVDIVDDLTWNNPIGGANLYYSTDDGITFSAAIPMTLDRDGYFAYIPAQALGTTVTYYVEAWDSFDNMATTDNYSFGVDDPTWIWYDTGGTGWTWFGAGQAFSPVVIFENPFFNLSEPVQINAVDGLGYNISAATPVAASLHIYSWDGTGGLANFVDVTGPIPVTFDHTAYEVFDLTGYNIQIAAPYFVVSYDLPVSAAFLYDSTYDYGTTYVIINGALYTMSSPGSWCIGANVQTAIEAPTPTIAYSGGNPVVSWDPIVGVNSYSVYGANEPYAVWPGDWGAALATGITGSSYTYTGTENKKFFRVISSTVLPVRALMNNHVQQLPDANKLQQLNPVSFQGWKY